MAEAEPNQWTAEPVVCKGCEARERKEKADSEGDKRHPGTRYRVINRGAM